MLDKEQRLVEYVGRHCMTLDFAQIAYAIGRSYSFVEFCGHLLDRGIPQDSILEIAFSRHEFLVPWAMVEHYTKAFYSTYKAPPDVSVADLISRKNQEKHISPWFAVTTITRLAIEGPPKGVVANLRVIRT